MPPYLHSAGTTELLKLCELYAIVIREAEILCLSLLRGDSSTLAGLLALLATATSAIRTVLVVQIVLLDIVDDPFWHEVANGHISSPEKPNLRRANVVLNELLNDPDVVLPGL